MLLNTMKARIETVRAQLKANVPWQPFRGKYIDLLCDLLQAEVEHVRDIWQRHASGDIHSVIDWLLGFAASQVHVPWYVRPFIGPILDAAKEYLHANVDVLKGKVGFLD